MLASMLRRWLAFKQQLGHLVAVLIQKLEFLLTLLRRLHALIVQVAEKPEIHEDERER